MKNKQIEDLLLKVRPCFPSADLKQKIIEEEKKLPKQESAPISRLSVVLRRSAAYICCFVALIIAAVTFIGFYGESYYEVYIDINPSIAISVNRFGVISNVRALNQDAENCLENLSLKGKSTDCAVSEIAEVFLKKGYLCDGAELYISGFSDKNFDVSDKVGEVTYRFIDIAEEKNCEIEVVKDNFSSQDRKNAAFEKISPLKYKYIDEILKLDDSFTIKELTPYSISDITNIYTYTIDSLNSAVVAEAEAFKISPVKYNLVKFISKYKDETNSVLLAKSTKELKEIYGEVVKEVSARIEAEAAENNIPIEKYRIIFNIINYDSENFTIDNLKEKTVYELQAIEYMLEKYNSVSDVIKAK